MFDKEKRNKILHILLIVFAVGFFVTLNLLLNQLEISQANSAPVLNSKRKEIYHIISKFDMLPSAASKAIPSIVHISFDKKLPYKETVKHNRVGPNIYKPLRKRYQSLGSGIIVTSDGYILTNNHVIENLGEKIRVEIKGNRVYKAKIIGKDPKTDLAVLKINEKDLPYMKFGDSKAVRIGDVVLAIGNPFGIGESVSMGIISATGRSNIGIVDYEDFIQTDAALNPGNSGGALIDIRGELIGINTAIMTKSGGYEGISFAIPSNMAMRIFREILKKGKVERGWIGIAVQNMDYGLPEFPGFKFSKGLLVVDVITGSPGNISGIKKEDILVSANGIGLKDKNQLRNLVAASPLGENINFRVLRNGEFFEIPVNISKLPDDINIFDVKR